MKKILSVLLAIVLTMTMAACRKAPGKQDGTATTAGSSTTETTGDNYTTESNNTAEGTEGTLPSDTMTPPSTDPTDVTTHTHKYTDKVTAATCTADGYTTHTCACGESYTDTKITATGHSFGDWKTTKAPTATATGEAERTCANCSEKETRTLGKLIENHTHSYSSTVTKAATCSAEGVKTCACSCGDAYTERIAKTAHNYKDTVIAPSCTNGGYTTHTCTTCGTSYSDAKTNATGHAYSAVKNQNPTCTQQGYTLYRCSRCEASYKDNVKPAAGHDYDVTSNTATCTADGKKTETCYFCGDKKVTNSPAKGHGTTRTETKDATTEAAGYTRVVCTVCNGVISETTIPKLEDTHNCSDHMQRINCKNLKDGAVGIHTDKYRQYTSVTILACAKCGYADTSSLEFAYSSQEATAMIVEMINQLRYEVYGTHAYDVQVATHHSAAEWAAEYITTDFFGCTPFVENIAHINLNGNLVKRLFDAWKNSPGHYAAMIDKDRKYISLGVYVSEATGTHSALVMWNKDELYLDNPNYTWECR
ncbi:MAG: CAP domain-containing protein [Ruminococcaceae bacterium]|nr:CAP domain-containing protein [Oscillospiraceae bacterium]